MTATIATTTGGERFVCKRHNMRDEKVVSKEEHIDPKGEHENWLDRDIKTMYHELFDNAVEEYNAKQERTDRKISDYFQKVKKDKQKNFAYEMIVGVYQKKCKIPTETKKEILKEYYNWFDKEFGEHLKICGAYYHNDECGNDPHMHLDYIPVADNMTKGMKKQNSLSQALTQLGFITENKSLTNQMKFERYCNDKLEELCKKRNIIIDHPMREYTKLTGKHIRHRTTHKYIQDELEKTITQKNDIQVEINKLLEEHKENYQKWQNQNKIIQELDTEIDKKKNELNNITKSLEQQENSLDTKINELKNNILKKENEKEELKLKLEDAQKNFNATDKYLSIVKDNINKYQNKIDNGNNEIEKLKDTISQQEKQIEELENKKTTNINTIQNLSDKTINDIETIKKYNLKNEYEDYVITDVKEIKPLELNDLPIKKDMFGNLIIEKKNKENLQKILTVHNELIKQNYKNMCANIFNISEIKKESDNKYNGYKSIKTKNEKLEIENTKLKSSLELKSDYDLIKARYKDLYNAWNHIQIAIDKLDIREPIEKQVNIQQKSRNNGEELTLY